MNGVSFAILALGLWLRQILFVNNLDLVVVFVQQHKVLKSVNSNLNLAVHSPKLNQAKTHFLSHLVEKKEKIWLRDLNPRTVDQKLIVLTITP